MPQTSQSHQAAIPVLLGASYLAGSTVFFDLNPEFDHLITCITLSVPTNGGGYIAVTEITTGRPIFAANMGANTRPTPWDTTWLLDLLLQQSNGLQVATDIPAGSVAISGRRLYPSIVSIFPS